MTGPAGPAGPTTLQAAFTLPAGWVRLPAADARPKGLLRRDPFEVLAREIVGSGAVIPDLLEPTRDYLRHMAQLDPEALGVACHIAAPSRTENTFANVVVVGPASVPHQSDGEVDWDELTRLAASPGPHDEARATERVQLPWGPAVKATWTRSRGADNLRNPKQVVGYWVIADTLGALITVQGDVSADASGEVGRILSDIDAIAVSVQVSPG